jgi:hypothetical protein
LLLLFAKSFAVSGVMIGRSRAQQQTFSESPLLPFLPHRRLPRLCTVCPEPHRLLLSALPPQLLHDRHVDTHFTVSDCAIPKSSIIFRPPCLSGPSILHLNVHVGFCTMRSHFPATSKTSGPVQALLKNKVSHSTRVLGEQCRFRISCLSFYPSIIHFRRKCLSRTARLNRLSKDQTRRIRQRHVEA